MKSLLKEFTGVPVGQKPDLKNSDSSDAGSTDIQQKAKKTSDIGFSLMRNTINSNGEVTGSDVADYLERAAELNDEVDTVPFGLETDDGDIIKVYVNAEQADEFADELKKMLGLEDDIEEAINKLAQKFDIVDVVWPKDKTDDSEPKVHLGSDDDFDVLDDGDDELEVIGQFDSLDESLEIQDPKEPTSEEAAAYQRLSNIVSNLESMGSPGVRVATCTEDSDHTKIEMIRRYLNDKYSADCESVRSWLNRSNSNLPFWL